MIITISGLPGAGKTTVGRLLAARLGYEFFSVGELRGRFAMERGLTIDKLNELGEKQDWTDTKADEYTKNFAEGRDRLVVEGRLAFYVIPRSFKIFLEVDPRTGAERVFNDHRPDEYGKETVEETMRNIEKRVRSDDARYRKIYGIDFLDRKQYDLVIDTTKLTPQQVAERILERIRGKDTIKKRG